MARLGGIESVHEILQRAGDLHVKHADLGLPFGYLLRSLTDPKVLCRNKFLCSIHSAGVMNSCALDGF